MKRDSDPWFTTAEEVMENPFIKIFLLSQKAFETDKKLAKSVQDNLTKDQKLCDGMSITSLKFGQCCLEFSAFRKYDMGKLLNEMMKKHNLIARFYAFDSVNTTLYGEKTKLIKCLFFSARFSKKINVDQVYFKEQS